MMAEYICADLSERPGCKVSPFWERRERVVRCRDCAMYDDEDGMCMRDPEHTGCGWYARPDGFCAWGKPREEA